MITQSGTATLNSAKSYTNTEINKAKNELNTAIDSKASGDHNHDNEYAPKSTTYSKTETQELIESAKRELNTNVNALNTIKEITLTQTKWGALSSGGYYLTVTDSTITSAMNPVCDVKQSHLTNVERIEARKEWSKVYYIQTSNGTITFQCEEKPTIDLVVLMKGV